MWLWYLLGGAFALMGVMLLLLCLLNLAAVGYPKIMNYSSSRGRFFVKSLLLACAAGVASIVFALTWPFGGAKTVDVAVVEATEGQKAEWQDSLSEFEKELSTSEQLGLNAMKDMMNGLQQFSEGKADRNDIFKLAEIAKRDAEISRSMIRDINIPRGMSAELYDLLSDVKGELATTHYTYGQIAEKVMEYLDDPKPSLLADIESDMRIAEVNSSRGVASLVEARALFK
jgi:hypothetical protein